MANGRFNITANGEKARIDIIGNITNWINSSDDFNYELQKIRDKKINDVEIYINSFGGSVFQANEISNIIIGFSGKIKFILGAVCASAATLIVSEVVSQKNDVEIEQYSNGQFMIHNVQLSLSGEIKDFESAITLMRNLQNNAISIYAKQTKISETEIAKMMDKETWFTAKEALAKGFITKIINQEDNQFSNFADIKNCGYNNLPKNLEITNKKPEGTHKQKKKMHKDVYNKLGLKETASDVDVLNKITELEKAKKDAEQKFADLEAQTKEEEVINFLNKAVADRKILESEKANFVKIAKNDFETVKEIINLKPALPKLSDGTSSVPNNNGAKKWEDYTDKEIDEIRNNNKELFVKLYNEMYSVQLKTSDV